MTDDQSKHCSPLAAVFMTKCISENLLIRIFISKVIIRAGFRRNQSLSFADLVRIKQVSTVLKALNFAFSFGSLSTDTGSY